MAVNIITSRTRALGDAAPRFVTGIDWSSPLTKSLRFAPYVTQDGVVRDLAGLHGVEPTLAGGATIGTSQKVNSHILDLPGSSQGSARFASLPALVTGQACTLWCRTRLDTHSGNGSIIFGSNTSSSIYWQLGTLQRSWVQGSGPMALSVDPDDGLWHDWAFVSNGTGGTARTYRDGVEVGAETETPVNLTNTPRTWYLGAWTASASWDWDGKAKSLLWFQDSLSADHIKALSDPGTRWDFIEQSPVRYFIPAAGGGQTIAVGLASETDTALAITPAKSRAVGLASETDTALAITVGGNTPVGLASETDTALAVTPAKAKAVGLASETDTALAITVVKGQTIAVGIATETDTALALGKAKARAVGLASETDTALGVTVAGEDIVVGGIDFTLPASTVDFTLSGHQLHWTLPAED